VVERQAPLAGLQATERRDVEAGALGDLLERQSLLGAQLAQPATDADINRLSISVCRHGKRV
jgi:hypothetical protein